MIKKKNMTGHCLLNLFNNSFVSCLRYTCRNRQLGIDKVLRRTSQIKKCVEQRKMIIYSVHLVKDEKFTNL